MTNGGDDFTGPVSQPLDRCCQIITAVSPMVFLSIVQRQVWQCCSFKQMPTVERSIPFDEDAKEEGPGSICNVNLLSENFQKIRSSTRQIYNVSLNFENTRKIIWNRHKPEHGTDNMLRKNWEPTEKLYNTKSRPSDPKISDWDRVLPKIELCQLRKKPEKGLKSAFSRNSC